MKRQLVVAELVHLLDDHRAQYRSTASVPIVLVSNDQEYAIGFPEPLDGWQPLNEEVNGKPAFQHVVDHQNLAGN